MSADRPAVMLEEVLGEPQMLAGLLDAYAAPGGPLAALPEVAAPVRIAFSGLGSSRFAALDAASRMRADGQAAWAEYASADAGTPPARDVIFVAISASGSTPETVAAAERHRGTGLVVAVTNREVSAVVDAADVVLPLFAGEETSGVSTRTFLATNAVLTMLANRLCGASADVEALRPAVDGLERLLDSRDAWLPQAADLLDAAEAVGVIGPASTIGLAEQGAMMLREGPRLRASAHEATDWLHTAIYTALPGFRALLLPGAADAERLTSVIAGRGGATVEAPPMTGPAQLVLPAVADLLAVELWRRAGSS
jgi:glucosamine--fructose-6-phosphate aminotransferase (isomerizing)